jgi:hypothetical protein
VGRNLPSNRLRIIGHPLCFRAIVSTFNLYQHWAGGELAELQAGPQVEREVGRV